MKYTLLLLLLSSGCASVDIASLKTLASFDLKCLPYEITTKQLSGNYFEAYCDGRKKTYFRSCTKDQDNNKMCNWIDVQ